LAYLRFVNSDLFLKFATGNRAEGEPGKANPQSETRKCGSSSVGRALASQAKGRGFESRLPLKDNQGVRGN
jgi:hypothetical protein